MAGSIRSWQRSAIASIFCPVASLIRSDMDMAGAIANLSGLAPVQSKLSSATPGLREVRPRARPDPVQEPGDALPGLGASVKATPLLAHPAHQLVTHVDRDD